MSNFIGIKIEFSSKAILILELNSLFFSNILISRYVLIDAAIKFYMRILIYSLFILMSFVIL